eukprot:8097722-Lingulodinium_polyedra.AAC.1
MRPNAAYEVGQPLGGSRTICGRARRQFWGVIGQALNSPSAVCFPVACFKSAEVVAQVRTQVQGSRICGPSALRGEGGEGG